MYLSNTISRKNRNLPLLKLNFMKPEINDTKFGNITVDGQEYSHDIVIRLNGEVKKRKKKLSKEKYGTSHKISLEEAKDVFEKGARQLIIG